MKEFDLFEYAQEQTKTDNRELQEQWEDLLQLKKNSDVVFHLLQRIYNLEQRLIDK